MQDTVIFGLPFRPEGADGRYSFSVHDLARWLRRATGHEYKAGETRQEHASLLSLAVAALGSVARAETPAPDLPGYLGDVPLARATVARLLEVADDQD